MQLELSSTGETGGVRIWTQAVLPMTLNGLFHSNLQLPQIPQRVGSSVSGKEQGHSCSAIPPLFAFWILCGSHSSPTSDFLCFPHWCFFHQINYVDSHLASHVATPTAQSWFFSFHISMGNYIRLQHLLFSADPQFCISLELSSQFSFQIPRQPGLFCTAVFPWLRLRHLQLNQCLLTNLLPLQNPLPSFSIWGHHSPHLQGLAFIQVPDPVFLHIRMPVPILSFPYYTDI